MKQIIIIITCILAYSAFGQYCPKPSLLNANKLQVNGCETNRELLYDIEYCTHSGQHQSRLILHNDISNPINLTGILTIVKNGEFVKTAKDVTEIDEITYSGNNVRIDTSVVKNTKTEKKIEFLSWHAVYRTPCILTNIPVLQLTETCPETPKNTVSTTKNAENWSEWKILVSSEKELAKYRYLENEQGLNIEIQGFVIGNYTIECRILRTKSASDLPLSFDIKTKELSTTTFKIDGKKISDVEVIMIRHFQTRTPAFGTRG